MPSVGTTISGARTRENILIDGKKCVEIDITASHLTAYLCLSRFDFRLGLAERHDLYGIDGLPRECVKLAIMLILGKGTTTGLNWFQLSELPGFAYRKYTIKNVVDRVLQEYPVLSQIEPEHRSLLVWRNPK